MSERRAIQVWRLFCDGARKQELLGKQIAKDADRAHNKAFLIKKLHLLEGAVMLAQAACERGLQQAGLNTLRAVHLDKKRQDAVFQAEHERLARSLRSSQRLDKQECLLRVALLAQAHGARLRCESFAVLSSEFRRQKQMRFTVHLLRRRLERRAKAVFLRRWRHESRTSTIMHRTVPRGVALLERILESQLRRERRDALRVWMSDFRRTKEFVLVLGRVLL